MMLRCPPSPGLMDMTRHQQPPVPCLPRTALLLLALALVTGCEEDPLPPGPAPRYQVTIRRTSYGVPHISASDLGSLGYGQGFAFAEDNACTVADQMVRIRGERARYFGPGPGNVHIATDFAWRALDVHRRARESWERQSEDLRQLVTGYVAGFNRFLSQPEASRLPCAGQPWLGPISEADVLAYSSAVGVLMSSSRLLGAIAAAQPPGSQGILATPYLPLLRPVDTSHLGSNGWALGAERTQTGRGMLVANPHFPWEGELRLWESHLTVPGQLNVYGATLLGFPGVLIGFNEEVAWTHTVSLGARLTAYALKLVPGKPTSYLYNGEARDMTARPITLQVRRPDGSLEERTFTAYSSHYGPIIALPGLGWSQELALTYRDTNLDNEKLLQQFLGMNRARSLDEFKQAFASTQGIPWVHTMAASRSGDVWYADAAATPNLGLPTLQAFEQAQAQPGSPQSVLLGFGIILLDGSTSRDEWLPEAGARTPGLLPFDRAPQLARRDFVFNSNDSYWLSNPSAPLEGFWPLHGPARTARSPRTRINAVLLTEVRAGGASGADGRFTLEELQQAILSNRSVTAELLREQVVQRCQASPTGTAAGRTVDLRPACQVLANWNGRYDRESVGPTLWRELLGSHGYGALFDAGQLFAVPFSASEPVNTPRSLQPAPSSGPDPLADKLAAAVLKLEAAAIPLDRPLGQAQFAYRGTQRIPLSGGIDLDGVPNVVAFDDGLNSSLEPATRRGPVLVWETGLTAEGYVINAGTSFLMAMEFLDSGVRARALLTYGQTATPDSPLYRDQLQLFSQKQWRSIAFSEEEISDDPALVKYELQEQ
jgi:acyl-homoserine-lactone acylase